MGTHASVKFIDYGECILNVYHQYDGYPDGVGLELAEFLKEYKIVNGYTDTDGKIANGIGCLAAQYVASIKKGVGSIYISQIDDKQQYCYVVLLADGKVKINYENHSYTPRTFISKINKIK